MDSLPAASVIKTTVHAPPALVDASQEDASRLLELLALARTRRAHQAGKSSLEQTARLAGLGGSAYYTGRKEDGKAYKILKPSEYIVAAILQKEERLTAIPAGWLEVAPVQLKQPSLAVSPPPDPPVPESDLPEIAPR